jgi:head-tail adaptor
MKGGGGALDRTIAIQRAVYSQSASGEPVPTWVTLSTRPASLQPITGSERFAKQQIIGNATVAFVVRWAEIIADITPIDRVIYPASALVKSPSDPAANSVYDIQFVEEIGRREGLRIFSVVRQDERD